MNFGLGASPDWPYDTGDNPVLDRGKDLFSGFWSRFSRFLAPGGELAQFGDRTYDVFSNFSGG